MIYDLSLWCLVTYCLACDKSPDREEAIIDSDLIIILYFAFSLSVVWRAQVLYWSIEVEWFAGEAHAKSHKISPATEGNLQQNTGWWYERTYQ